MCYGAQDVVPVRLEGEHDGHRAEPGEEEAGERPYSWGIVKQCYFIYSCAQHQRRTVLCGRGACGDIKPGSLPT